MLSIKGKIYNELESVDSFEDTDTSYELDDNYELSEQKDLSSFLQYFFNITIKNSEVDNFKLDHDGNLFVREIIESIEVFNMYESINIDESIDEELDATLDISHFFRALFGLAISDSKADKFSILNDGRLIVNDVLEKQNV